MRSDVQAVLDRYAAIGSNIQATQVTILTTQKKLADLMDEQSIIERTKVALDQSRPLLSASSVSQVEKLANSALHNIFEMDGTISYDIESKRFVLNHDNVTTDLVEGNGGGLATIISFILDLYLLVKNGCRRLLVYDESFYAVSECYFENFMKFVRESCKKLHVDLLLVSHDARITDDMVDHVIRISDGKSIILK